MADDVNDGQRGQAQPSLDDDEPELRQGRMRQLGLGVGRDAASQRPVQRCQQPHHHHDAPQQGHGVEQRLQAQQQVRSEMDGGGTRTSVRRWQTRSSPTIAGTSPTRSTC